MIGWALAAALAGGCTTTTSSTNLPTDGISAAILVSATSAGSSTVKVQMSPGNGVDPLDVVQLAGGDVLYAETGGQRRQMAAGHNDYESTFLIGAAETQFQVSLDRARPDQTDAPDSVGTLPAPFDISPVSIVDMSRGQPAVITWSPSGTADKMVLEVTGSCVEDTAFQIDGDPGTYAFSLDGETLHPTCSVTMTLSRSRTGVVDANFSAGSNFLLEQSRTAHFLSSP